MPAVVSAESLFFAALDLPAGDRAAFLDTACGGDTGLRGRIEKMLAAQPDLGEFLGQPALTPIVNPEQLWEPPPRELPGAVIAGKYQLLKPIGQGGMGTVWAAEQLHPVRRRVAVKLIRGEFGGEFGVLARFEAERQAIARMDHPHIAKLLDAGTTGEAEEVALGSGRPYFVMEVVDGVPLNEYCDQHRLSVPDRLRLFAHICRAVQHAHQKGVVHRDLKPSNILVEHHDGRPAPRVIDFGLAKATGGTRPPDETLLTRPGTVTGTPLYMAPEQADVAADIDTRADVYALGVNLYELLTGTTPIEREQVKQTPLFDILHAVRDSDPPPPSRRLSATAPVPGTAENRRTEPGRLCRTLRGDLDWVVMKALAKERDRRYESAAAFAADVERFLNHEPVLAGPPSTVYRLRKFGRRHRIQVVAAGLVLLALLAGIAGTTFGLIRAEQRREDAELAQRHEAEQRAAAEEARAREVERREEADRAREREARERAGAVAARVRTRQALDSMVAVTAGDPLTYARQPLTEKERQYLARALPFYQELAADPADDEESRFQAAGAAMWASKIQSRLASTSRQKEEAVASHHRTIGLWEALVADSPAAEYRRHLAGSRVNLGSVLHSQGELGEAERQFVQALAVLDGLTTEEADRDAAARCHYNLGLVLESRKPKDAEEHFRQALDLRGQLATDFPDVPAYRAAGADAHAWVGKMLSRRGKWSDAEAEFRKALTVREEMAAEKPSVSEYRRDVGFANLDLGIILSGQGKREEAEKYYRRSVSAREKLAADFPGVPEYQLELGGTCCDLGRLILNSGDPQAALPWYDKAVDVLTPVYDRDRQSETARRFLFNAQNGRALARRGLQKYAEAVQDWDRAIPLARGAQSAEARAARAVALVKGGREAQAVAEAAELVKLSRWDKDGWYRFACVYALASGKIADKSEEYAARAVESLGKAVTAGFRDAARIEKDADLDSLRNRDDLKTLLAELRKK